MRDDDRYVEGGVGAWVIRTNNRVTSTQMPSSLALTAIVCIATLVSYIASTNTTENQGTEGGEPEGEVPPVMFMHGTGGTKLWADILGAIDFPEELDYCRDELKEGPPLLRLGLAAARTDCMIYILT